MAASSDAANKLVNDSQNSTQTEDSSEESQISLADISPIENCSNFRNNVLAGIEQMALDSTSSLQKVGSNISDNEVANKILTAGPLQDGGLVFSDVMKTLEDLIVLLAENEIPNAEVSSSEFLRILDDPAKVSVVSHTLAAYVSTLEPKHLRKLTTRLVSDCSLWISRLFRFFESSACFHEDSRDGMLKICRMVLHLKYPKYNIDGYEALYSRPPVIYISRASRLGLGQYLCSQLGLPLSSISTVPFNTVFGSQHKMDIAALEKMITEDVQSGKVPLLVIANAGTPVIGDVDNVQRLQDICKQHELWLHVEGNSLAALCLVSVPNLPARIGDSLTLKLGQWLGIPAVPFITLYKTSTDSNVIHAAGLNTCNLNMKLHCLPLWVSLCSLGHDGVVRRIKHCFELSRYFNHKLSKIPPLRLLSGQDVSKEAKGLDISDVMNKTLSTSLLFEILFPTVVFRYVAKKQNQDQNSDDQRNDDATYFDNLNSWLAQVLLRDVPKVCIEFLEIDNYGVVIRYCPLEHAHAAQATIEDIDDFISCLQLQVGILNATVSHKETLKDIIKSKPNLQLVELNNWAGLGGVRYIPELWMDRLSELPDSGKEEVNKLNTELVVQLRNTDSAFSIGEGIDGLDCVRFGMVTEETDMEELIIIVDKTGKEIEESSKFLETMAELVKVGIEEANKDLEKENEEKIIQEGVFRHVPLVGSLVNWWSPLSKEVGIKGRSFNLQSGVVESTENIYKYHMQIQHGVSKGHKSAPAKIQSNNQKFIDDNGSMPSSPTEKVQSEQLGDSEKVEHAVEAN